MAAAPIPKFYPYGKLKKKIPILLLPFINSPHFLFSPLCSLLKISFPLRFWIPLHWRFQVFASVPLSLCISLLFQLSFLGIVQVLPFQSLRKLAFGCPSNREWDDCFFASNTDGNGNESVSLCYYPNSDSEDIQTVYEVFVRVLYAWWCEDSYSVTVVWGCC